MSAVEEMMCVVRVDVTEEHSCDGCVLASTLCKYALRKGDFFVLSWARVGRVMSKENLFRAVNVLWRCAQYFVIAYCG